MRYQLLRRSGWLSCLFLMITAGSLLLSPAPAEAAHSATVDGICYDCHTLNPELGDDNTSLINSASRTLPTMKIININNGNAAPDSFACTYCHNDALRAPGDKMYDALGDFGTQTTMHYVGKTFPPGNVNTNNEYVSNQRGVDFDENVVSDELQCVYCHEIQDPADPPPYAEPDGDYGYPEHGAEDLTNNPKRLKNVNAPSDYPAEFCVTTCHDGDYSDPAFPTITPNLPNNYNIDPMGHMGWGAYTVAGNTIYEPRGTALKTSDCGVCHDTHSSNKTDLFSDGTDYVYGTTTLETAINELSCTTDCHEGDDPASAFRTQGHGKPTNREGTQAINHNFTMCTPCHTSSVSHRELTNPMRFAFVEDTNSSGIVNPDNVGVDDDGDGVDNESAGWSYSQESICRGCHFNYNAHGGSIEVTGGSGYGSASCLDCHDPHGKAVGSNIEMVRATIAGEPTTYQTAPDMGPSDFLRADGAGVCDNEACHGSTMVDLMAEVNDHQGLNPGDNCTSCHTHAGDGPSFQPECGSCHGYPPNDGDAFTDNANGVGVHDRHVTGLSIGCSECHYRDGDPKNAHNESNWTSNIGIPVPRLNVDVVFNPHGGAVNPPGTTSYPDYVGGDMTGSSGQCLNVSCHNPDSNGPEGITPKGDSDTNLTPLWKTNYADTGTYPQHQALIDDECTACHVESPATNPEGGSHHVHDNSTQKGYGCETCHNGYFATSTHANLVLDETGLINFGGTLGGETLSGSYINEVGQWQGTCSNLYCHGATLAAAGEDQDPDWGDAATAECGDCHDTDPVTDPVNPNYIASGVHTTHVDVVSAPYGPDADCTDCHTDSSSANHVDGYRNFSDGNVLSGATPTNACDTCHNGSVGTAKTNWGSAPGTWLAAGNYCEHCHDATASQIGGIDAPNVMGNRSTYGAAETGHNASGTPAYESGNDGAAAQCVTCHDETATPHIDGALGDTFVEQRLRGTISSNSVTSVEEACDACHQPVVGGGANESTLQVSRHGNSFPDPVEGPMTAVGCSVCHEVHGMVAWPGETDVNWWMFRSTLTTPNNDDQTVQLIGRTGPNSFDENAGDSVTSDNLDDACATCHLDSGGNTTTLSNHTTPPAGGGIHENNSDYYGDERARDCTLCHSHDYDDAFATEDGFMPSGCDSCHGYPPATGSHDMHVNTYGFTCDLCHDYGGLSTHNETGISSGSQYAGTPIATIRQVVDVAFADYDPLTLGLSYNQNGLYSQPKGSRTGLADGTCDNLYCHGADAPFPAPRPSIDIAPEWSDGAEGPGSAACGIACHGQSTSDAPDSNAHLIHTSGYNDPGDKGYGYSCSLCHYDTTQDGSAIHFSAPQTTLHVNTRANVVFDGSDPRLETSLAPVSSYGGSAAVGDAASDALDSCSATYCHSPGNVTVAPFTENPSGGPRQWDNTGILCTSCHGQAPAYADGTPKANKHGVHTVDNAYGACDTCHSSTGTELTDLTYGTYHVNMAYNVDPDPANSPLGDFTYSAGGCDSTNCHGGMSAVDGVTWDYDEVANGHFTCDTCHVNAAGIPDSVADTDNFSFQDWTMAKVSDDPLGNTEYTSAGHGSKLGGADTGTPVQCADCHDSDEGHDITGPLPNALPGSNPFRLQSGFTCANTSTGCHESGAASTVVTHGSAEMVTAGYAPQVNTWGFDPKCIDCHDPHGDEVNLHMVQEDLWDNGSSASRVPLDYGNIGNPNLVFTDDATGEAADSYAWAAQNTPNYSGVCQECHETSDTDMQSFRDDTNPQGGAVAVSPHPSAGSNPGDCSACHPHDEGFAPSGCAGCHGDPATGQAWPDGSGGTPSYVDDSAGAHDSHVETVSQYLFGPAWDIAQLLAAGDSTDRQKQTCAFCHPDPGGAGHYNDTGDAQRVDVWFDGDNDGGGGTSPDGNYLKMFIPGSALYDHDTDGTYDKASLSCANLTCHNEQPTPTGANNWGTPPATPNCSLCHPDGIGTGAHGRHTAAAQKAYDCLQCHVNNGTYPTSTTTAQIRHQDGEIDMEFTTSGSIEQNPGTGDAWYDKDDTAGVSAGDTAFAYKDGNYAHTCYNVYCHGGDNTASSPPDWVGSDNEPEWDQAAVSCGDCHDTDDLDTTAATWMATELHPTHLEAGYGPSASCGDCHTAETAATHADGTKTFIGDTSLALTAACTGCHNGSPGTAKAYWSDPGGAGQWLTDTIADTAPVGYCEHCHDITNSTVGIAAPNIMGNGTTYGAAVTGHNAESPYESTIAGAAKDCTTCHNPTATPHINGTDDSGFAFARINATINVLAGPLASTEEVCSDCHQNTGGSHDAANQVSRHGNDYATPIEGAMTTVDCSTCHEVHGLVSGGSDVNWWMFRYNLTAPGIFTGTRTVQLTERTGTNSFDEDEAGTTNSQQLDDACAVCHIDDAETSTLVNHTTPPAGGAIHENGAYVNDHRGDDCSVCHLHDLSGTPATEDGFMPVDCGGCHAFPPPTNAHSLHVTTYSFDCGECHYGAPHNGSGVDDATTDPGNFLSVYTRGEVQVAFDTSTTGFNRDANNGSLPAPTWTPGATSDLTTCSSLACHNPDNAATGKVLAADETNNVPVWGTPIAAGDCTACHGLNASGDPAGENHQIHDSTYGYACETCHSDVDIGAGAPGRATHADLSLDTTGVVTVAGTLGSVDLAAAVPGYDDGTKTCSAVYCHGDVAAITGGAQTQPVWGTAASADCGDCHGADDNSTVDTAPTAFAHPKHAGNGAGERDLECAVCHDGVAHVDGYSQVAFDGTTQGWTAAAAVYNGTTDVGDTDTDLADTCSNLWCHSDAVDVAVPNGDGNPDTFFPVEWDDAVKNGAWTCGECHFSAASGATLTHWDHVDATQKNYACAVCHEGFGDDTTSHADHLIQNSFSTSWNGIDLSEAGATDYSGTEDPLDAAGSCASLYCHGDFSGGTTTNTPDWYPGSGGQCGDCHNETTATMANGSHPTHFDTLIGPSLTLCSTCHTGTARTDATHVNAVKNFVTEQVTPDLTATDLAGTAVCNACHGITTYNTETIKAEWPDTNANTYAPGSANPDVTCESCHGAGDALANSQADGLGASAPDTYGGGIYVAVDGGHGNTNFATPQDCVNCHDEGLQHFNAGADDRVVQADLTTFCQYCHDNDGVDDNVVTSAESVDEIGVTMASIHGNDAYGTRAEAIFTVGCDQCHDPHGSSNLSMIKSDVEVTTGVTTGPVVFTSLTGADSFDEDSGDPSDVDDICVTCHINGSNPGNPMTSHDGGAGHQGGSDYRNDDCTTCHLHEYDADEATQDGFMPLGCNSCHGDPPVSGAHTLHRTTYGFECNDCHFGNSHNPTELVTTPAQFDNDYDRGQVEVGFDPAGFNSDANNGSLVGPGSATKGTNTGDPVNDRLNTTCSNLACHNPDNAVTNKVLTADDTSNVPTWGTPITSCTDCHGTNTTGDPAGENHQIHDTTYGFGCATCHSDVDIDASPPGRATHGDLSLTTTGVVSVAGILGSVDLAAAGPSYDDGTSICSAVYCHGDTAEVPDGTDTTPIWGNASTGACGDCHGADDNSTVDTAPASNAHGKHAGNGAGERDLECAVCHDAVGHVDGLAQVAFDATVQGWSPGGAPPSYDGDTVVGSGFGTVGCDSVYCHSDVDDSGTPDGFSDSYTQVTWDAGAQACGTCHASGGVSAPHAVHAGLLPGGQGYLCVVCHDTYGDDTVSHADHLVQNQFADTEWNIDLTVGAQTSTPSSYSGTTAPFDAVGTCANLYCHGDFPGGTASNTQDWTGSASCGSCHNTSAATPPPSFAHPQHTGDSQAVPAERQYSFTCNLCHVAVSDASPSIVDRALHVNAAANVAFDTADSRLDGTTAYGGTTTVGDADTDAGDICSNLYCHGSGTPFPSPNGGTDTTPEWSDAATADCGACHGYTPAAPMESEAHIIHAGDTSQTPDGYSFPCSTCHVATTADSTTVADVSVHADGLATVNFDDGDSRLNTTLAPVSSYSAGASSSVGATYGQCDNTYCHSPGTDRTAPFEEAPNGVLAWDGSGTCTSCHEAPPGYADGAVIDGSAKANKHSWHQLNGSGNCKSCHTETILDPVSFMTIRDPEGYASHVNFAYSVAPNTADNGALNDFTFSVGGGGRNGSCATANCHGGNSPSWSDTGPITCDTCHSQSGASTAGVADANNFQMKDWVQSKISNDGTGTDEYGSAGHGAKGLACAACHDSSVIHDTTGPYPNNLPGANPFRLVDQDGGTGGVQFSCSYTGVGCHEAGTIGPATGKDISTFITHDDSVMSGTVPRTWPAWDPQCVNCHDPHGDRASTGASGNLSMVQRELYDNDSFSLPAGPPPAEPTEQTDLEFTDDATGASAANDSFAWLADPWSGVCQECHEAGDHVSFADDTTPVIETNHPGTDASPPGDCSSCHPHADGFSASGCNGCHGVVGGQYWPDGSDGNPTYVDDSAGAHDNHVETISQYLGYGDLATLLASPSTDTRQKEICAFCHPNPGGPNHFNDTGDAQRVDVWYDGDNDGGTGSNYFQVFQVGALAYGNDAGSANATYAKGTLSCSNLDCHNEQTTPTTSNDWGNPPASPDCSLCHPDGAGTAAHGIHTASAQKGYDCSQCHVNNGIYPTSTVTAEIRHQNGQVDMEFTTSGTIENVYGGGDGAYAKGTGFAYRDGDYAQTCTNLYCHGADNAGWGGADTTPEWNNTPAIVCGSCHDGNGTDGDASTIATSSHPTHFDTLYGPSLALPGACASCHTGYAVTDGSHVNGTKSFETQKIAPADASETNLGGTGVCDACHGNASGGGAAAITTAKSEWANETVGDYSAATGGVTCESCHGQYDLANSAVDATGVTAPDMVGGANWGAAVRGHTLANASTYPGSGNDGAEKACVVCHLYSKDHTWGADGTTYADLRIEDSINGVDLSLNTTVEEVCRACHQNAGGDQGMQVSTHGNTGAAFQASNTHDDPDPTGAEDFEYRCDACHEPHGMTANGRTGTSANIYMIKPAVEVRNWRTAADAPAGGPDETTTIAVVFEATSLANSFDDGATPGDNICVACHVDTTNRPGYSTLLDNPSGDGTHSGLLDYSNDEQGNNCAGCHTHDFDQVVSTVDGIMPLQCDTCHGYPPNTGDGFTDNADAVGVHDRHVNDYGYSCNECHYNNDHNEAGWTDNPGGSAVPAANVDVGFDTTWGGNSGAGYTAASNTCTGVTCHNPDDTVNGITGKSSVADSGNDPQWLDSFTAVDACLGCHETSPATNPDGGSHYDHDNLYAYACETCHSDVDVTGGATRASHADTALTPTGVVSLDPNWNVDLGGGSFDDGTNLCSDVFCHGEFTGGDTANNPQWGAAATGDCGTCHGATAASPPSANAHQKHAGDGAGDRQLACNACHYGTTQDGSTIFDETVHADGASAVDFDTTNFTWLAGAAYNGTTAVGDNAGDAGDTCSTLYCHSDARSPATYATPNWDGTAACGSCHAGDATAPSFIGTDSHTKHVETSPTGKNYPCATCHEGAGDETTSHADYLVQNSFSTSWNGIDLSEAGTTDYSGTEDPFDALGSCASLYCHGDFTGGLAANTPDWGGAAACGTCHNDDTADMTNGSHPTHFDSTFGPGIALCGTCHTGSALGDATHVNAVKNFVTEQVTPDLTATDLAGTDVCNACHGITTYNAETIKAEWPDTNANTYAPGSANPDVTCESCHGDGDALANAQADGLGAAAPDMTQYFASAGHGSVGTPQDCVDCHNEGLQHFQGGSDDRIVQADLLAFCHYCHDFNADGDGSGEAVNEEVAVMVSTHGNTSGGYTPPIPPTEPDPGSGSFSQVCVDCHNPHGTTNLKMIKPTITTPNSGDQTVVFTADTQFDTSGGSQDICQVCHTVTEHNGNGPAGNHAQSYQDTNQCRGCHQHEYDADYSTVDGFMPQECNSCHTYPGLDTADAEHTLSGVHVMHTGAPGAGGDQNYYFSCFICHYNYDHNESGVTSTDWSSFDAANVDIRFDAARNPDSPTYDGNDASQSASPSAPGNGGTGVCANLYCHGQNATLQSDWNGAVATFQWSTTDPARYACNSCHDDPPTSGAHELHTVDNGDTDRTDCGRCHTNSAEYPTTPITNNTRTTHNNAATQVTGAGYTGQTVAIPPNGYCTNACHATSASDGRWDDGALECDACHYYNVTGDATSTGNDNHLFYTLSSPSHNGHFDASGRTFACVDCHADNSGDGGGVDVGLSHATDGTGTDLQVVEGKTTPVQANAEIVDTAWITIATDWTPGTKTCTNMCHDPSAAGTYSAVWGNTNNGCSFCHSPANPGTGEHDAHLNSQPTYGRNVGCTDCHANNTGNDGHMTGTVDLSQLAGGTPYSGTPAAPYGGPFGTCTTTTCHQDGRGTTVTTEVWGSGTNPAGGCDYCHATPPNPAAAPNEAARHSTHIAETDYVGDSCGACHTANTNQTSMNGQPTHMDGTVDIGGTGTVDYASAPQCTNDCHAVDVTGTWTDTNALDCLECHEDSPTDYIGPFPSSGLHVATVALAHDDDFTASNYTCADCHAAAGPSDQHLDGSTDDAQTANYSFNVANINDYDTTNFLPDTGCQASCHSDGGDWWRKWVGVEDDKPPATDTGSPGAAVCGNCHGDFTNGFNWDDPPTDTTTVDHTDPYGGNTGDKMNQHSECENCHGWGHANYNRAWLGSSNLTYVGHGDGHITMNGPDEVIGPFSPAGTEYNDDTGGCAKACHLSTFVLNNDSGWTANYGDFGSGDCEGCHNYDGPGPNVMGDGTSETGTGGTPKPYDDGTWGFNVNGHGANGTADNTPTGVWGTVDPDAGGTVTCTSCHDISDPTDTHNDTTYNSIWDGLNRNSNTAHLISTYFSPNTSSPSGEWDPQVTMDDACFTLCHSGAGVTDYRHPNDNGVNSIPPLLTDPDAMQFGSHLAIANADGNLDPAGTPEPTNGQDWPIMRDLNNGATSIHWGLCVTCHDPHGTDTDEPSENWNRMMRMPFGAGDFCVVCHQ